MDGRRKSSKADQPEANASAFLILLSRGQLSAVGSVEFVSASRAPWSVLFAAHGFRGGSDLPLFPWKSVWLICCDTVLPGGVWLSVAENIGRLLHGIGAQ